MKIVFARSIGFVLLAIYLILIGLMAVVPSIAISSVVLGVLALLSGVFILLGI